MKELVILVEFDVSPDKRAEFRRMMLENAAASMRDEPGCRQFDVLEPVGQPEGRFILYEIYEDEAAFDAHTSTPHYQLFSEEVSAMIIERKITRLALSKHESVQP
jgi:(4S)-4-hydroxy-5-phosphonooxypentane-2,3-dione isomerase